MVFEQVLILVVFVAVGYFLSKIKIVNSENSKILSTLLVYVFLPCNLFKTFIRNFNKEYISDNYILLFHTDDSEKTTGNNVVLMYSVYDNNTDSWLEPKVVSEGNSSDLYAKSFVHNNELYVVWQKIKTLCF